MKLRRQTELGGVALAGSSRSLRLDPFALPVRFTAGDTGADEHIRSVELDRERVVVRRAVRGIRMAVKVPVRVYLGVALRIDGTEPGGEVLAVTLEHRDPGLSVPLFRATDSDDIVAAWQAWSRVLGLPLLVAGEDGQLRQPFHSLGALRVWAATPRRRRHNAVKRRRASMPLRRRPGQLERAQVVHSGEREIIARN